MELVKKIVELLAHGRDEALALGAPERPGLTHGELRELVRNTVVSLNTLGFGRGQCAV